MSHLKVYGMKGSTCGRRVLLALEEAKAPYEFELVHLFTGANKTPEYLALHPFGRIPVLKDGDFTLFESRAIIRYIASVYDKAGTLYPADAKTRALVEQWISVEQSYYVAAEELVGQLVFAPMMGGQPNEDKVKDADARLHSTLAVLDKHLSKSRFFAGDNFTIADIVYIPYTFFLEKIPRYADLFSKYPSFQRWWKDVTSRPSWQKVSSESEF